METIRKTREEIIYDLGKIVGKVEAKINHIDPSGEVFFRSDELSDLRGQLSDVLAYIVLDAR